MQTLEPARVLFVGEEPAPASSRFEVKRTKTWRDAVRLAEEGSFIAIVVDVDLPEVDALEMVKALRQREASAATLLWITNERTNDLALTAAEAGVFQLLDKPATERDLERVLTIAQARAEHVGPLRASENPDLRALSKEFDELVARMQTPKAKAVARSLFSATSEDFGRAAVAGAKKPRG
ncbi:MAG: response regulator [Archangium sp.]